MEPDQELHSFPYDASFGGKEHHYRITQDQAHYGVEQDGVVIATVGHREDACVQLSGAPLHPELLTSICDHIEAQYE